MIPRKRLQVLLYMLRIYYVFGDGDPGSENLQFLDYENGSGVGLNSELDNFNYTNWSKISLQTDETTEFSSGENTISENTTDEIKTNKIDDSERIHDEFGSTISDNEIHTSEETNRLEGFKNRTAVRVINKSIDSITVSWIVKSFYVSPYRIEWYTKGFSDYGSNVSNLTTYTIDNLKPCSNYTVMITDNTGEDSNNGNQQTFLNSSTTSSVPGEVQNLTIDATTDSVNISWTPPIENTECVTKYMIEVFNRNHSISTINTINTFRVVKDLEPCTEYKFVVKAVGEAGPSKGENRIASTEFDKPGRPKNLKATAEEEKSLRIFWDPPEKGATCIKKYRITLNTEIPTGNPAKPITKYTESNETEIIIDKLFPCTSYTVQTISVGMDNGDSDFERIRSPFTNKSVADAPKRAKRPDVTINSVKLFWNIGNENNCTLESVIVICNYTGTDGVGIDLFNGTGSSSEVTIDKFFMQNVNMTVSNLSAYTNYNCIAKTINSAGESQESKIVNVTTLEDVPSAPELNVTNVTDSKYIFDWIKPEKIPGKIRSYEISLSWEPLFPIPDYCSVTKNNATIIDGSLSNYTYEKGSPFSNYSAQIRAETGAGWGNFSEPIYFVSEIGLPSAVTNFTYKTERNQNDPNVLNTILQWGLPCASNGQVELFNISYYGKRPNFEDHNYIKIMKITNEVNKNDIYILNDLGELRPSYSYTFIVTAKIKNATELGSAIQFEVEYPAGIPVQPDIEYVKMITIDPQKAIRTTTSAAILLPIFPVSNGNIQFYAIMVSQMGYNKAISTRHDLKSESWPNASCWQESKVKDFSIPYQATKPEWDPYPTHVVDYGHIKAVKYILGADIDCKELSENTDSKLYCNGPLKPGTWYHIRMRAFTNGGYADSAAFLVKTNAEMNVPIIIGIVFGIMILGIITTLLLLVRRCSLQAVLRRFLHSDMPGSPVPSPFTRRKFISHCQQLADNPGKLSNEFQLLQTLSLDLQMPTNAACLQANRKKNRYSDILPYDFSRVKLDVIDNDPNTDYINASFITGYTGEDEYIACQGPKEETTYDFWRMVDQYDVKIIVMLTQLFEKGKEKCHQYFPVIRETFNYEKMSIRCTSELDFRTCTQRTLVLQKDEKKRSIMHLHFKDWPDHDVPEDFDPMINFCQIMRRQITANKGLVVIHCSAGIGRTGTLIAIDMLLQSIRDNRKLDVFGTVYRLRRHRLNMVQRESQYAYIYNCIRQVLKNPYFLKNYKPPPVDPIHKNSNKKKKDSANSNLDLVNSLDNTWRKDSLSLSMDSMEAMYETSTSSTLENPKSNGMRYSKSTSALDSKPVDTCVVKSNSQGYVTYESVKDSSFGSSNVSLIVSDLQGSRRSIYENVTPLFRSRSDQLIDGIDTYMSQRKDYESKKEPLEKDTSL